MSFEPSVAWLRTGEDRRGWESNPRNVPTGRRVAHPETETGLIFVLHLAPPQAAPGVQRHSSDDGAGNVTKH
jgi:hypothetical protein